MKLQVLTLVALMLCLCGLATACGSGGEGLAASTPTLDVVDSAAAEATALVQQARATAIVLEARAQATAMVEAALNAASTPSYPSSEPVVYAGPTPSTIGEDAEDVSETVGAGPEPEEQEEGLETEAMPVQITRVGFAADGGMIVVRFLAPPEEAENWWPGTVSVTDEGNGTVYDEIPVMPRIGPLIGRPKVEGQPGYVMLMNVPPYLQPGTLVTIVLGAHKFEHVPVE